jgi:hypothetical protein
LPEIPTTGRISFHQGALYACHRPATARRLRLVASRGGAGGAARDSRDAGDHRARAPSGGRLRVLDDDPDGTPIRGTISVSGTPGAYTGAIDAAEHGRFPIKNVVVDGQTVTINAEHPQGPLDVRLTFVADDFTGSWQLGTDTGEIAGKRKP